MTSYIVLLIFIKGFHSASCIIMGEKLGTDSSVFSHSAVFPVLVLRRKLWRVRSSCLFPALGALLLKGVYIAKKAFFYHGRLITFYHLFNRMYLLFFLLSPNSSSTRYPLNPALLNSFRVISISPSVAGKNWMNTEPLSFVTR